MVPLSNSQWHFPTKTKVEIHPPGYSQVVYYPGYFPTEKPINQTDSKQPINPVLTSSLTGVRIYPHVIYL